MTSPQIVIDKSSATQKERSKMPGSSPAVACNLSAIAIAERPKYSAMVARLRAAVSARRELSNGYVYTLESEAITLSQVGEWMSMERLCCPFLTFRLSVTGNRPKWLLSMTGPSGAKGILLQEFPPLSP